MLATSFISKYEGALVGVETGFSEQEKQIIEAIRRMQPDAQGYLGQILRGGRYFDSRKPSFMIK